MVNRFFQPSRGQYVSQFIPEQLPVDLMAGVLGSKQQQEDQKQAQLLQDGEWRPVHLSQAKQDSADAEKYLQEFKAKRDEIADIDVTTIEGARKMREYTRWVNDLRNNKDIRSMESWYNRFNEYQEVRKKIIQDPKKYGGGESLARLDREWANYMQGEGHKGSWNVDDVHEALDYMPEMMKPFKDTKPQTIKRVMEWMQEPGWYHTQQTVNNIEELLGVKKGFFEEWKTGAIGRSMIDITTQRLGLSESEYLSLMQNGSLPNYELEDGEILTKEKFEEFRDLVLEEKINTAMRPYFQADYLEGMPSDIAGLGSKAQRAKEDAILSAGGDKSIEPTSFKDAKVDFEQAQNRLATLLSAFSDPNKVANLENTDAFKMFPTLLGAIKDKGGISTGFSLERDDKQIMNLSKMPKLLKEIADQIDNMKDGLDKNTALSEYQELQRLTFEMNNSQYLRAYKEAKEKYTGSSPVIKIGGSSTMTGNLDDSKYGESSINRLVKAIYENNQETYVQQMQMLTGTTMTKAMNDAIENGKHQFNIFVPNGSGGMSELHSLNLRNNGFIASGVSTTDYDPVTGQPMTYFWYEVKDKKVFNPSTGNFEESTDKKVEDGQVRVILGSTNALNTSFNVSKQLKEDIMESQSMSNSEQESALNRLNFNALRTESNLNLSYEIGLTINKPGDSKVFRAVGIKYDAESNRNIQQSTPFKISYKLTKGGVPYYKVEGKFKAGGEVETQEFTSQNAMYEYLGSKFNYQY